jgi:hypothetical protein
MWDAARESGKTDMLKPFRRVRRAACRFGMATLLIITASTTIAQQVIVIGNDQGGYVGERAGIVDRIRALGTRVEIRGAICYSACTMYLGAGNVCITPATRFGFHGPSRHGQALDPAGFDHWSGVMARYYALPLRQWYMTTARYERTQVAELSGAELIRLGYPAC